MGLVPTRGTPFGSLFDEGGVDGGPPGKVEKSWGWLLKVGGRTPR